MASIRESKDVATRMANMEIMLAQRKERKEVCKTSQPDLEAAMNGMHEAKAAMEVLAKENTQLKATNKAIRAHFDAASGQIAATQQDRKSVV